MKGILFKPEMFQAVIEERKTQTRRLGGLEEVNENPDKAIFYGMRTDPDAVKVLSKPLKGTYAYFELPGDNLKFIKPRYQPGEVVYLKEPYLLDAAGNVIYKHKSDVQMQTLAKWKNKMFMPARHARHFIEIVTARPERLQDITKYDALKEGVKWDPQFKKYDCYQCLTIRHTGNDICEDGFYSSPRSSFKSLWKSINGEESWNKNPWVWVYQFKLLDENKIT